MSRSFSVRILKNTGCFIWDSQKLFAYNFCIIPIIMIVQWLQQLTIISVLVLTFICSSFYKSEYFDSIFWSEILQTLLCKELFWFQCFTKGNGCTLLHSKCSSKKFPLVKHWNKKNSLQSKVLRISDQKIESKYSLL